MKLRRFLMERYRMVKPRPPLSSSDEVTRPDIPTAIAMAELSRPPAKVGDHERFKKTPKMGTPLKLVRYDRCVCAESGCRTEPMCSLCPRRELH